MIDIDDNLALVGFIRKRKYVFTSLSSPRRMFKFESPASAFKFLESESSQ